MLVRRRRDVVLGAVIASGLSSLVSMGLFAGVAHWRGDAIDPFWLAFAGAAPIAMAGPTVAYLLELLRRLAGAKLELEELARRDSMTGLLNRGAFFEAAEAAIRRARGNGRPLTLLVLDVDHFKAVNDSYGHAAGDEALRLIARTLLAATRRSDVVGRLGGEEFGVLLEGAAPDEAALVADRILSAVRLLDFEQGGERVPLSASAGLAALEPGLDLDGLFARADAALYAAKRAGRGRARHADPSSGLFVARRRA
ncbi:MAG: GGDEF domain-containing protein [Geminicoccaceae bacterium]|nr:GGDEF domain-containing protein [Geminicoccaceae bacterium]MCS7268307.1 GGDEF domain-containing protein [Geminicoccaceae bacterium]MCX7629194.1 GGDEF domain-containing protein [Geminicoccaceae bacterium]MDW8125528.1 GGDEF domain-containing protein [Geminicoccaceae bacterium]MDW8341328.1 GGDEF domain-containing protein [Geminicoccaceae bacterium]